MIQLWLILIDIKILLKQYVAIASYTLFYRIKNYIYCTYIKSLYYELLLK